MRTTTRLENNINFPAGILQPPFFIKAADDAVNFGAAGAVVGHELTHGFDDQGRQFDADGNLRDWWTAGRRQGVRGARRLRRRTSTGGYTAVDDVKLNGKLTLGENVADNGGLRLGVDGADGRPQDQARSAEADGFTPEQRFFVGWAQMWCENRTEEIARSARPDQPALARQLPHERRRLEHAGVPEGVQLPGHIEDGEAAGLPGVVKKALGFGLRASDFGKVASGLIPEVPEA